MKKKEMQSKILKAFISSKYRWRTAKGISKETAIRYEDVSDFLTSSENVIKAKKSNKKGQPLFALREKYNRDSSFGIKVLNAITNKIN